MVAGHVRKGAKNFDAAKSYFTDKSGVEIDTMATLTMLSNARDMVNNITAKKSGENRLVSFPPKTVCAISANAAGNLGFAVTWGERVGTDSGGSECTWVCLFVTSSLTAGRHQWVSAFPATGTYVEGKKL